MISTVVKRTDDLFWAKVDKSGGPGACWPWLGSRNPAGYGQLQRRAIQAGPILAPRYSLFLANGEWPRHFALHRCDNPPCVNPAHLRVGTAKENTADAVARGRAVMPPRSLGEKHPRSRLTDTQVDDVRRRLAAGEMHRVIAADLGVARTTITAIARGQNRSAA